MRGSTLNRHSSCVWRRDSYFVMILMSLISSLVLVSSVSLVSSQPEPDPAALSADPHGGSNEQADNPSHETAATNIPKIESVAGRRSYYIGNTAQLECVVRDLGMGCLFLSPATLCTTRHFSLLPILFSLCSFFSRLSVLSVVTVFTTIVLLRQPLLFASLRLSFLSPPAPQSYIAA